MLLADLFGMSGPDAAVIIAGITAIIVATLKVVPQKTSQSNKTSDDLADIIARLKVLEFQAKEIWDFLFRRATSEVVLSGKGTANSPLTFTNQYACLFDPIKEELQDWYQKSSISGINERDILIWMEGRFGEKILDICLAHRIPYGAGRLMAYAIAQDTLTIEIPGGSLTNLPSSPENIDPPKQELT